MGTIGVLSSSHGMTSPEQLAGMVVSWIVYATVILWICRCRTESMGSVITVLSQMGALVVRFGLRLLAAAALGAIAFLGIGQGVSASKDNLADGSVIVPTTTPTASNGDVGWQ
ncbi:hypothetical protein ABZ667_41230 [Streptomyces lavendulae]|uniref:hypothetical protein n=1 Tax=Streptomyces lavendulae TaxID=1914 RepID=UPI0033CDCE7F